MAKHLQITDIDTTDDMPASKGYVDTEVAGAGGGASVLDDLTDVVISTPSNGQVLKYDSGTSKWVNGTDATGGAGSLSDGDYGDITVSGTGTVMNIDAGVVTTTELGGDITTAGKALLDDANAAAQLTTLGLTATATELNYTDGVTSAIQTQLDGKAASSHTHSSANITDFDEAVEDKIGAKVIGGTGISVSYNDTTGNTTVTSTAGDVYTTVGSSGAAYTTIGAAITAGATKIAVITNVTESGSITIPADGVLLGLNQSIIVTMPAGGDVTLGARAKAQEITVTLNTGKVALGADAFCSRVVINKSSSTGYILEFTGARSGFYNGRIYDTATTLSTSRVVMRQIAQKFVENYCEIADAGTTSATAWFRTSNQSGDTGAVHIISKNYFYSTAAWAVGAICMNAQYADGSISENKFEGPVGRGIALKLEDYHETILSNYFLNFETQLLIPEDGSPTHSSVYRVEVIGNRFASASGRCLDITGYANSFIGNSISGTNQTIRISPSASGATYGYGNTFIGNQIRSSNVVLGANSQNNTITGNTFLNSATISDSGSGNRYFLNEGGLVDNIRKTVTKTANYTATGSDYLILCNAASGAITITLPAAASSKGLELHIKKIDISGNNVIVDANGSETIDGQLTQTILSQYTNITVLCDGTGWNIL